MRYIGNKSKLLFFIENILEKYRIRGNTLCDLFAGTGSVGDYFKDKFQIISNDFTYYSYVINKAKLNNSKIPEFNEFKKSYKQEIFYYLNNLKISPNSSCFTYNNYSPIGGRMFFTEINALKIDGIRLEIENLYRDKTISKNEYYFLLASLLENVTKYSNTSGTYEAFFKFWESRAQKDFYFEPIEFNQRSINSSNEVFNEDSNILAKKISGDIVYIDPPYSVTQYISAYHYLETLAKYDCPQIKGVGGKREKGHCVSYYSKKNEAFFQFEDLFRQLNFKHIILSYSNQSIVDLESLLSLARKFAKNNQVFVEYCDYKEYKNHRESKKRNGEVLKEVIIYFEKDLEVKKSPLNYSGSKDQLIPELIKHLPQTIDTFVDCMAGAFNVGINIIADRIVFNEINPFIFELIKKLYTNDKHSLISEIEDVISNYQLAKGDKNSYINLRNHYNNVDNNIIYLYVLHMYSFQNMIRFNNNHKFNTPIGVAGYSDDIKHRILNFKSRVENVDFLNDSFTKIRYEDFPNNSLFYFDPPYFITSASYNDGKRGFAGWNSDNEVELLNILKKIDTLGQKFMLSNVIEHKEKKNNLLYEWCKENEFKIIPVGKTGWRYAKDEVLITNY